MAIFNSYVKLPEGIQISSWCSCESWDGQTFEPNGESRFQGIQGPSKNTKKEGGNNMSMDWFKGKSTGNHRFSH